MKKKILYFSHVPWGWIKQRPQFIAEKLSEYLDLYVAERKNIRSIDKKKLPNEIPYFINVKYFFSLPIYKPLVNLCIVFDWINEFLLWIRFNFGKYQYIWVTSILSYFKIQHLIPADVILVFDCMDDELEFPTVANNRTIYSKYEKLEKKLLNRADFVICSSEHLKQVLLKRTKIIKDISVINNATVFPDSSVKSFKYRDQFKLKAYTHSLVYLGTIASWFDFDSILNLLNSREGIDFYLIGPKDTELPQHNNLHWLGVCEHDEIWGIMKQADILVMPFVINSLIESVNPVKLYEYIWSNKPIIASRYRESEKFEDYVYLYSSAEEFLSLFDAIKEDFFSPKQKNMKQVEDYIMTNTWDNRVEQIAQICKI